MVTDADHHAFMVTTFAGVGFFLKGTLLSNNSIVLLSNIGEDSSALYCLTERELCCGESTGGANRGFWRFPNGTALREDTNANIYSSRGFSSIKLNHRSSVGQTGVYTCVIPDGGNVLRSSFIGVYASNSEGMCKVLLCKHEEKAVIPSLNCIHILF